MFRPFIYIGLKQFIADYLASTVNISDLMTSDPQFYNGNLTMETNYELRTTYSMYYGRCYTVVSRRQVKPSANVLTSQLRFNLT